jgi:hypothetical protein
LVKERVLKNYKVEDILAEELKREMFLKPGLKFRYIDDWDMILNSVFELPIEYNGFIKQVKEMKALKEVIDIFTKEDFVDVKRSESRRKQMQNYITKMHMYYNIIFSKEKSKVGYGALIYFPKIMHDHPERSGGIILIAKCVVKKRVKQITYEKAKFNDFLLEVRPFIEIIGDLYRQTKKSDMIN